jgi:hypothetical protein
MLRRSSEMVARTLKAAIPVEFRDKVTKWSGLSGKSKFLGSGTKGSAFRFGDKVLKVTNDESEAVTCSYLKSLGNKHPNIYNVYKVGRFKSYRATIYLIIYEYVENPTGEMEDVINVLRPFLNYDFEPDAFDEREVRKSGIGHYLRKFNSKHERYEFDEEEIELVEANEKYAIQALSAAKYLWDNDIMSRREGLWNDWGEDNIGRRGDDLILIDVGYSLSPRDSSSISALELESLIRSIVMEHTNAE